MRSIPKEAAMGHNLIVSAQSIRELTQSICSCDHFLPRTMAVESLSLAVQLTYHTKLSFKKYLQLPA